MWLTCHLTANKMFQLKNISDYSADDFSLCTTTQSRLILISSTDRTFEIQERSRMQEQRFESALVYVKDMKAVFAIGGINLNEMKTTAVHDLETNSWKTMLQSLNNARAHASACVVGHHIYVVGGGPGLERIHVSGLKDSEK